MIRTFLLLPLLFVLSTTARAEIICGNPTYNCIDTATTTVGGIRLTNYCRRAAGTRDCRDTNPKNECTKVSASIKCNRTNRTCIDQKNGECLQWRETYSCLNENEDMSPAHLIETTFGPTREEIINHCTDLDSNAECELQRTTTIEGEGVRNINRKMYSRSWWKRERTYSCITPGEGGNTCGPLESNPTCKRQGDTCLVERNGVCTNREYHYRCGIESGELQTSCQPINVCVGDNCLGVEQETSDDFGASAAWLNVLAQMQKEFRAQGTDDPNKVRFFQGEKMDCSKAPFRNCCAIRGLFNDTCSETDQLLKDKRNAGATHYLGVTCSQKIFGKCIKKRYHYCTYGSKFARVFMEEYKKQVDKPYGGTGNPNCGHVTVEDFGNVDIDKMDLSPVFGDIMEDVQLPVSDDLKQFYKDRFPNADKDADKALGEKAP